MDFGLIVDVETTGLDPATDKIIELGFVEFMVESGGTPAIINSYGAVEDPGCEISTEITKITGITNQHVKGRKIDWRLFREALSRAGVVIAHNLNFDKGFLLARPELADVDVHWACSMRHIDWEAKGFRTKALNYLAADHGFVNPFAHRAIFDCAATFRLIEPYLEELIERSYQKEYLVLATGAPFASKDLLKGRGYRWDPEKRVWKKIFFEDNLEAERAFLAENVYGGNALHEEVEL